MNPRVHKSQHSEERRRRKFPAAGFFTVAAIAAVSAVAHVMGVAICPLKRFTGIPCLTCGSTRAAFLALSGDFRGAFLMQPLATALMALAGFYCIAAACAFLMRREIPLPRLPRSRAGKIAFWTAAALLAAANWAYVICNSN